MTFNWQNRPPRKPRSPEEAVLDVLHKREATLGELKDATGLPYAQLQSLLSQLQTAGRVHYRFDDRVQAMVWYELWNGGSAS